MSTGPRKKADCTQDKETSGRCNTELCADSQSLEDDSLAEENTLSACLLRILQSGQSKENSDNLLGNAADKDKGIDYNFRNHALEQGSILSPTLEDLDNRKSHAKYCKRGLKSCIQRRQGLDHHQGSGRGLSQNTTASQPTEGNQDKLKCWRAAGEALRKVLQETSVSGNEGEKPYPKTTEEGICLKVKQTVDNTGVPCEGSLLPSTECPIPRKSPVSDDPMNAMLEEYHSKGDQRGLDNASANRSTHVLLPGKENIQNTQTTASNVGGTKMTPGLASVRERIQQITSKINLTKSPQSTAGQSGAKKGYSQKYNRTTGPLQTRSSSIGHGSSSESEDGEVETKRHKMFLPRCRRIRSSSHSPKSKNAPVSLNEEIGSQQMSGQEVNPSADCCPKCGNGEHVGLTEDVLDGLSGAGAGSGEGGATRRATLLEILSDLDSQEDMVLQKLQQLSQRHDHSESDDANVHVHRHKHRHPRNIYGNLVSGETDSMPNLADIESSLHSDDNETLGESDLNERRWPEINTTYKCGCEAVSQPQGEKQISNEADTPSSLPNWGSDCDEAWSEQSTLKRNKAKTKAQQTKGEQTGGEKTGGEKDDVDGGDELEEIEDLVFQESPPSDHDNGPLQIASEELAALTDLISDSSNGSASDRDAEADDEFECDCAVCQQRKSRQVSEWVTDDEQEILGDDEDERIEYYNHDSNQQYVINMAELTPLDLLFMREGRRELLELMFQNVIMQMLAVYPELLDDQAPPPAMPSIIKDLPVTVIDSSHVGDDSTCPICLCNFEIGEETRELPCHHSFHNLCIQAWLTTSGTCPVCRHVLNGTS